MGPLPLSPPPPHDRRVSRRRATRVAAVTVLCAVLPACGPSARSALCSGQVSVGEYVLQFGQGLANFGDEAAASLESDSLSALDVILAAREVDRARTDAEELSQAVADFVTVMNSYDWIISDALEDERAINTSDVLGTEESLRRANVVEAVVLDECGSVPTLPRPSDTAETLPGPVVPSPTATEPPASPPDDASEDVALGAAVGTAFGLTLDATQVACLGAELRGVTDATGALAGPGQYQAQFQAAFDSCEIDFEVPTS